MTVTDERLAEALRARADWLDLPRDVEAPRPYIAREQFRAAADRLDELPSLIADVERLREALTKAADQFEFYAREHRTKAQACEFNGMSAAAESALAKALTNERFAAMCRAVVPEETADG